METGEPEPRTRWAGDLIRWSVAIGLLVGLVGLAVPEWSRLQAADVELRPDLLLVSLALLMAHFFFQALAWHLLSRTCGPAIRWKSAVVAWHFSMLGKYVPGKVFVLLGRLWAYRRAGFKRREIAACFSFETVLVLLASTLVAVVSLAITGFGPLAPYRPALWVVAGCLVLAANPRLMERGIRLASRLFKRPPITVSLGWVQTAALTLGYAVNAFLLGFAFFVFVRGLLPLQDSGFLYLTGSFLVAGLSGMLALFAPGGLGVRDGVLLVALLPILPPGSAAVTALAARLWTLIAELALAAVYLVAVRTSDLLPNPVGRNTDAEDL